MTRHLSEYDGASPRLTAPDTMGNVPRAGVFCCTSGAGGSPRPVGRSVAGLHHVACLKELKGGGGGFVPHLLSELPMGTGRGEWRKHGA